MPEQAVAPINPFPKPDFAAYGILNVDGSSALSIIFTIVLVVWLAYTLVVTYHWIRYGHRSFLAIPLLVVHVMVSGVLILLSASSLH